MPKIVDHEQRRREIIEVTWRFIAQQGFDKLNLRDLAAAAGYANGGLKPYFPTRNSLLSATFNFVFNSTGRRIARTTRGLAGMAAIRAFAAEVLPLDEERRDESRVVIHFWHVALQDEKMAQLNANSMDDWRHQLDGWLHQVPGLDPPRVEVARNALMTFLLGAQITAVLDHAGNSRQQLLAQLDYLLESLH